MLTHLFQDDDLAHNLLGMAPFADCGCTAVFTAQDFHLYHGKVLLIKGRRYSENLWHVALCPGPAVKGTGTFPEGPATTHVLLLHDDTKRDQKYVAFVHACMGSPPPTTFLQAVQKGYLAGDDQFPRLTARMVRKHMPNSMATARGHLNKSPVGQPHALSNSVSARKRHHKKAIAEADKLSMESKREQAPKFDPASIPKSTTIHLDYTGKMPKRGSRGTLCYLIATWGSYIHLEPLVSMKGPETAAAITAAVTFFRAKRIVLKTIRMDNQSSPEVRQAALDLDLVWELVNPYQKEPNRAERGIRTAKNHMIAVRAGFHADCPRTILDRCLLQVELTLNSLHPYEYEPGISAYHGIFGHRFDFARHPVAPVGAKVLTWDSPDHRGSWADHGIEGFYLGPAMRHFRGFEIWVPQNASKRVSGTVWWFLKPFEPDTALLAPENNAILYPPIRQRLNPAEDGSDLLGRCFLEPNLGVCCITRLGPELNDENGQTPTASLHYRCLASQAEFYSPVQQIEQWITEGPVLQKPETTDTRPMTVPVSYPIFAPIIKDVGHTPDQSNPSQVAPLIHEELVSLDSVTPLIMEPTIVEVGLRRSQRKRKAPDFLKPKFKGKAYLVNQRMQLPKKQRVPMIWEYPEKERVSPTELKARRLKGIKEDTLSTTYGQMFRRYRQNQRDKRNERVGWWDLVDLQVDGLQAMAVSHNDAFFERPMPPSDLPPIFPEGPLNLNTDGTPITYKKSHEGPYAKYWEQADAEEMERLFKSGTIRPIFFNCIPADKQATYVNPVCAEKLKDDGAMKLRTRTTIGGDKVDYPYNTTAVTAELEAIKILINAMISDNCSFATVDLEDFYLGATLPHPEYIRIPIRFIPKKVIEFYKLKSYIHKGALYCVVLKTHYGLPQAGALSQARLFEHLESNGYHQLFHAPALFRNRDGTIRFALVVDDFAVAWSSTKSMQHFLRTLRKLYTIKVDFQGLKYLGISIDICRPKRHVTLSMPGYISKLLKRVRPNGVKGATTPSVYAPPNYSNPSAQKATVDTTPLAAPAQQKELQVVVGTLFYYARTVDPSILTSVHELGSVQAKPTLNDMRKVERLLQYVSTHQNHGVCFHASTMQLQVQSDASYLSRP